MVDLTGQFRLDVEFGGLGPGEAEVGEDAIAAANNARFMGWGSLFFYLRCKLLLRD